MMTGNCGGEGGTSVRGRAASECVTQGKSYIGLKTALDNGAIGAGTQSKLH